MIVPAGAYPDLIHMQMSNNQNKLQSFNSSDALVFHSQMSQSIKGQIVHCSGYFWLPVSIHSTTRLSEPVEENINIDIC